MLWTWRLHEIRDQGQTGCVPGHGRRTGTPGLDARGTALMVTVSAPAVDGRANEAVRAVVAVAFGVWPRQVRILMGERGRGKVVELDHAPAGATDLLANPLDR